MCGSILSSFHTLQRSEPEQLSLLGHEGAKKLKQAEQEGEGKSTGPWGPPGHRRGEQPVPFLSLRSRRAATVAVLQK